MPQIIPKLRDPLRKRQIACKEKGDLCFLITDQFIIPMWKAQPGWDTASRVRMALVQKPDLTMLRDMARGSPLSEDEIKNQAAMAYDEFYRRLVSNYENEKARKNGDVYAGLLFSKSHQITGGEQ